MSEVKEIAEHFTGFVTNESKDAYFILQRQVPPGGKIPLRAAYLVLGPKSGKTKELDFACWLRDNVLLKGHWGYYSQDGSPLKFEKTSVEKKPEKKTAEPEASFKTSSNQAKEARGAGRPLRRELNDGKGVDVTPKTIIEAPYEKARVLIEKCTDKKVLKKSLALTKHFAGKEEHMRHLMRRIEQVY